MDKGTAPSMVSSISWPPGSRDTAGPAPGVGDAKRG